MIHGVLLQGRVKQGWDMFVLCRVHSGPHFITRQALDINKSLSAGFNYENRFSIREIGTRTAGIIIPAGKASFGAIYSYFGYSDFRREMTGIACGLKLSEKIAAGVQVDYFSERTHGEYSNSQGYYVRSRSAVKSF